MQSAGSVVSLTSRPVVGALVTAAAYWLGTQIGLLLTPSQLAVSLMWPPNALLLSALLLTPRRNWPW